MTNESNQPTFDSWAIVELFGHARIAGKVSEATVAGTGFIRVDVPACGDADRPAFTRFYGPSAVYAMTPCDERVARAAAEQLRADPITVYVPPGLLLEDGAARCDYCGERSEQLYKGVCPSCWSGMDEDTYDEEDEQDDRDHD